MRPERAGPRLRLAADFCLIVCRSLQGEEEKRTPIVMGSLQLLGFVSPSKERITVPILLCPILRDAVEGPPGAASTGWGG